MTLPASGAISLGGLKGEFGGNASPKLSDYYKNGAFNKNILSTVPSSGTIALSAFYGASKIQDTVFKSSGDKFIYSGVEGDKIVFPNGNIHTVTNTEPVLISGATNAGIFTIIHSQTAPTNVPALAGPGITEIHSITNLPQVIGLSGIALYPDPTDWNGIRFYNRSNLTMVPSILPKNITTLSAMFSGATRFNQDISDWDVSNVTDMSFMFNNATAFNQPIGNWNVSNVTTMDTMFNNATVFNQPIGNWNVSNVTDMSFMFSNATAFNQPIGNWNVSNVTDMIFMFNNATAFNQPIGNWNVSNVTDMIFMFNNATAFNQDISGWCVSKIPSVPPDFAGNTTKFLASNKPKWGTCPRGY